MDRPYFQYTTKSRLDKAMNSLLGIIEGIAVDGLVNDLERAYLQSWISEHEHAAQVHPYIELLPRLIEAVADGRIDKEERADLKWMCNRFRSGEYYEHVTGDLQRLQSMLGGVAADGEISEQELRGLREWIDEHDHLRTCWPYDELSSLITGVLADARIDEAEHELLRAFFGEFTPTAHRKTISGSLVRTEAGLGAICAACPEVRFAGMKFCFTGESSRFSREELFSTVERLGGTVVSAVSGKVNFLVIGSEGNPCWAFACYGRKVQKALDLRKEGARIMLVHENDFHDAAADHG